MSIAMASFIRRNATEQISAYRVIWCHVRKQHETTEEDKSLTHEIYWDMAALSNILIFQRPFQEHKLEVPTMYKVYVRGM